MARSLFLCLSAKNWLTPTPPPPIYRILAVRAQSTDQRLGYADLAEVDTSSSSSEPLMRKLEDAIHQIIVQRAAPDWLPFFPGASYWVPPPRSQTHGIAQLVEKLANPLTPEETLCTTTSRGWPSSDYFIKGTQAEVQATSNGVSKSEDEDD